MTTSTTPLSVYQLRIVLRGISPLVWRRVRVRSDMTLAHLHVLLQIVFAWSDEHLHSFYIHGREYGSNSAPTCDGRLRDFCFHRGERFRYVYDFGAYWECDGRLEALLPLASRRIYPHLCYVYASLSRLGFRGLPEKLFIVFEGVIGFSTAKKPTALMMHWWNGGRGGVWSGATRAGGL